MISGFFHKYGAFVRLLVLTFLWTFAFGLAKYYLWAFTKDRLGVTLENLAENLALGSVFAYVVGGFLAKRFGVRRILIASASVSGLLFFGAWQMGYPSTLLLLSVVAVFGTAYGAWVIARSVLVSQEIGRGVLGDSAVTGIINAVFIIAIIIGSVSWGLVADRLGSLGHGVLVVAFVLALAASFGYSGPQFQGDTSVRPFEIIHGLVRWKTLFARYWQLVLVIAMLWSLSTVASQQVIQSSIALFGKTPAQAASVLLYSSIGAVFGNLFSAKLAWYRWKAFHAFNLAFAAALFFIPSIFERSAQAGTYAPVIVIAIWVGCFFAAAANLAEGWYFKNLEAVDEKEFGSSLYGIALALALTVTMGAIGALAVAVSWKTVFFVLALVALVITGIAAFIDPELPRSEKPVR